MILPNKIYKLDNGQMWDVQKACFINEEHLIDLQNDETGEEKPELIHLVTVNGVSDVAYLVKTLLFSNYPLGELADYSIPAIKRRLQELDEKYLTPRTLAGLAQNDQTALERWQEHENLATPLREKLATLMIN